MHVDLAVRLKLMNITPATLSAVVTNPEQILPENSRKTNTPEIVCSHLHGRYAHLIMIMQMVMIKN